MTSKREFDQVSNSPRPSHETTRFGVIYMPRYTGVLCSELPEIVGELACPQSVREAIDAALSGDNADRVTKAKYSELLKGYPEKLRKQILTAFDEPFNRIAANSLRAMFALEGKEASERWAAVVIMASRIGAVLNNGAQLKSYARAAWVAPGLIAHPVALNIPCPNCAKSANAFVALPSGRWNGATDWRVKCTHCGYEDCMSSNPGIGVAEAILTEEEIRAWVEKSPAVIGEWSASKARRDSFLRALRVHWKNIGHLLEQETQARVMKLRDDWPKSESVSTWLSLSFHTTLHESLALGIPLKLRYSSHGRYHWLQTDADRLLEKIPRWQISISALQLGHPAPHWRDEFDTGRAKIDEALEGADVVEAAVQTALFVENCRKNGLATPVVLNVELPEELRPAPIVPQVSKPSDRLRDVSIADLSEFLAKAFSNSLVVIQPDTIARQLHRFQKTRQGE
jgi:hypothetical protein